MKFTLTLTYSIEAPESFKPEIVRLAFDGLRGCVDLKQVKVSDATLDLCPEEEPARTRYIERRERQRQAPR